MNENNNSQSIVGLRFGTLNILERRNKRGRYGWVVLCECNCGAKRLFLETHILKGKVKNCGCDASFFPKQLKDKHKDYQIERKIYDNYKRAAKKSGRIFTLTFWQFLDLIKRNCKYCGSEPYAVAYNKGKTLSCTYTGIDREDNTEGYTLVNSVPCCFRCNRAKWHFSLPDFEAWLDQIARFRTAK